jgi:hypothetical protein
MGKIALSSEDGDSAGDDTSSAAGARAAPIASPPIEEPMFHLPLLPPQGLCKALYLSVLDSKNVCSEVYVDSLIKMMTGSFRFCHNVY